MKFLGTDLCGGENAGRRKRDQQNQCFEACFFFSIYILHTVTLNAAELPVSRSCGCTVNYCDSPETLKTCRFSGSFCSVRLHGGLFAFIDKLLEVWCNKTVQTSNFKKQQAKMSLRLWHGETTGSKTQIWLFFFCPLKVKYIDFVDVDVN